jgi:hypothetical protein
MTMSDLGIGDWIPLITSFGSLITAIMFCIKAKKISKAEAIEASDSSEPIEDNNIRE